VPFSGFLHRLFMQV